MNISIERRFLSLFLAFVMVFSLLPWSTVEVHAVATPIELGITGLSVEYEVANSGSTVKDGTNGLIIKAKRTGDSCNSTGSVVTVTLKNTLGSEAILSFTYSKTGTGTATFVPNTSDAASYTTTLQDEGTVSITVESGSSANDEVVLTLKNISFTAATASYDVTVNYDSTLGSVKAGGTEISSGHTVEGVSANDGILLEATPNTNVTFHGWVDASSGSVLSTATSYTLQPGADITVKAMFSSTTSNAVFGVGTASEQQQVQIGTALGFMPVYQSYYTATPTAIFDNLQEAANYAAASSSSKMIILMNDGVLPADDYTIPSGVTLLIPHDGANSYYKDDPFTAQCPDSDQAAPKPYRTLTIADGTTITVKGSIEVAAKHYASHGHGHGSYGGRVVDYYGHIVMQGSSQIVLNSGAYLYAWGYISGSDDAQVIADSGATIYEKMQVTDYRGGSATTDLTTDRHFPFSQYYIQNVEVKEVIQYGAQLVCHAGIYANYVQEQTVSFMGSSAMFTLKDGSQAIKHYDAATDRLIIDVEGDFSFQSITIMDYDTQNFVLPLQQNLTVNLKSGTTTIVQDLMLQPGCIINIFEGATLQLAEGKNVYLMDASEWGTFCWPSAKLKQLTYVAAINGAPTTRTADNDAVVDVNGTLTINGQIYASKNHAIIKSSGKTGVIQFVAAVGAVSTQSDDTGEFIYQSADGSALTPIYMYPVVLTGVTKNTDTTSTPAGTTYYYNADCDMWIAERQTGHSPAADDGDCTTDIKCSDCDTVTTAGNASHTPGTDDGDCTTAVKCANCDQVAIAAKDSHTYGTTATDGTHKCNYCNETVACEFAGEVKNNGDGMHAYACKYGCGNYGNQGDHSYTSVVTAPTCTAQGYTTYTCTVCGDSYDGDYVDANGHSYNSVVTAPTCTEQGYTTHTCSACGDSYVDSYVNANGHTEVIDAAVDPTCTETGLTEGKHCSVCGTVTVAQTVVAALGHSYTSEVTTDPTCTEAGVRTYTCSTCGDTYTEEVSATGHAPNNDDGDCTTAITCSLCGSETTAAKEAHAYSVNASSGKHTCTNCNQTVDCADADNDGDHKCDYGCQTTISSCTDEDRNHKCNECGANVNTDLHKDSATDGDHVCDYGCGETLTTCCDKNTDHTCDSDSACEKYSTGDNACSDSNSDGDHVCDYGCGTVLEECVDHDKDHACDNGCDVYHGTHEDTDNDHICDYGCKETIGTCEDKDYDHDCDYGCDKVYGTCEDGDKDHKCDYGCDKYFGEHKDEDTDHVCDYGCSVAIGTCEDGDLDHDCDYGCDKYFGEHKDEDTDHECDYGCSVAIGTCEDKDLDHDCDYGCDKVYGTCEDKNLDHKCDYGCDKVYGTCEDKDLDHYCDYGAESETGCRKYFGEHKDGDKNHACDYGCSVAIGTHADSTTDNDHVCDYGCGTVLEECVDTDKDHACDNGCDVYHGTHEDTDNDHECDYGCKETIGTCEDKDLDHDCDYGCDKVFGICEDEDNDGNHVCDYGCGKTLSECADSDTNHKCDECTTEMNMDKHVDSDDDGDHICDYGCGAVLEDCADCVWNYTDNGDGTHDAVCSICEKQMRNDEAHSYNENGVCACGNTAEAKVGETYYCFFTKAVEAAADGDTVMLLKSISLSNVITVSNKAVVIIASNGAVITTDVTDVFIVTSGGTLTLGENLAVNSSSSILWANGGTINVNGAVLMATDSRYNVACVDNGGTLNITSGAIIGKGTTPATVSALGANVNISGGEVRSENSSAVAALDNATVNISGGTVKTESNDNAAAYAKSGAEINVSGAAELTNGSNSSTLIAANGGKVNVSGGTVSNGVLAHESDDATVTISGGTIYGIVGTNNGASLTVSGGTFGNDVTKYCVEGYHTVLSNGVYVYGAHADCTWTYTDNGDGSHDATCSGCGVLVVDNALHTYNESGACAYCGNTAQAKIGNTYYCFLTEAIAAATDGQTVTMLKNASGAGAVIDKSITIDFGGYTYTFTEGVGSTGTPSNGFQILQGNTVVLKNGTLNVAEEAKQDFYILIQNYADLTVTDMTLDGTNLDKWSATDGDSYVLSNNSGTVNVNGETNITANDDGDKAFAFDVCKFQNYDAPVVNVNTTGTISGKIEVSESISDNLTISGGTFTENVTVYCDAEHHTVLSGGYYVYGKHDDCEKYYLDNGNGTHDGFCKGCDVLRTDDAKHTYTASDTCDFCDNTAQAKVGEAYYYSLVEAIAAATDGQTVTMLKNASGAGAVIDKSVTIDFGGYTYTFTEGVGSTGTRSNGFQILQGNTVVLKNGTLNVSADDKDEFYILIQNYADLTVTDMTLDGTNLDKWSATDGDSYVLSNNSGTVNVNGETNITANDEGDKAFAFDVCKFQNYDAPVVNVNTTGTISGKIEVSESISDNLTISGGTFTVDVSKYCGEGYHTVDAENNGLYIYGEHVYDNGVCKCGYVQDLNVSLTIRADGAEDIQPEIPSVKYGSTLNIDLDFSSFGTCYNWNSFSVVVNGAQVPCTFANGTLTVDGQYITGNVVVVVEAIQRHTVGTMQEAAYTAPTCDAVGYRTIVTYCGKCGYSFNTTVIEIPATGHNWAVSYSWSQTENGWTCTATHSCKNSDACTVDTETVTATGSEKTAATCTEAGWTIYTVNFTVDWAATQTKEEQDIPATGHDWNVSYEWKQENGAWNCIATRTCSCNASESASATVVSNVKAAATCMVNGWTTYTAVFTVPWAETQTKDVQDIPATDHKWSVGYEWEKVGDNWNCTATRICTNSETCTATETVTATVTVKTEPTCTEAGWTIYTATFAVDWAATQTKEEQDIPATGHNWSVSYEWKQENGVWICIATHTCANSTSCTEKANATVVSAVKTPANCKVAGTTTYTAIFTAPWASTQIKDVQDIPALNHNWSVSYSWTQVEGEWTCVATHTCANSDACTETATASVTGTVKTTATCTADGWTIFTATFAVDWAATQTKEEQDIPATGHSFGTTTYSWSADYSMCIAKHTCSCGAYETASAVIESATTEADCTTDGKIVYTAEFTENWAETQIEEVKIVAPGHSYGTTSYVWNSDSTACTAKRVCACGHEETATATVNTVPTAPTCTEAGYTTYTATFAEAWAETQSTVVPGENAKGHDYGAAIYTWSSDYSGCTAIRNCDCGAFETTTAVIDSDVVDATCTADGYIAYTAEFGEEWTDDQTVVVTGEKAKGHSYTETVTVPTCTESGYTTYTCACGYSYISDYVAAKGHSYTSNVTAPTCTEAGYTTYTCTCGHSYVSNYVSAKGHSYTSDVTAPTCTEAGYTTYTCTCGHSYISDYVNAAGHIEGDVQFRWDETNCVGTAYWTCETCNETFDIETTMTSVFTDGTCQVKAKTVYTATASLNGKVYTSTLTVEGELGNHEYVDGVCVHCDGLDAGKLLKGDVNLDGDVDAEDLTLLARHVTGVAEITNAAALANADVNGDHVIDSDDLTMHARYVAGIVTTWEDEE